MRFLLFELLPPTTETNLKEAIEAYCKMLFRDRDVSFHVSGDPQEIPIACYLLTYRLTQESLRNVLAHSEGSRVGVSLSVKGGELTVHVSDNGVTFDPSASTLRSNTAILTIRQRADASGGSSEVGTGFDGGGTSVTFSLPLHSYPEAVASAA
jgi:signal transduction histidine kinase